MLQEKFLRNGKPELVACVPRRDRSPWQRPQLLPKNREENDVSRVT